MKQANHFVDQSAEAIPSLRLTKGYTRSSRCSLQPQAAVYFSPTVFLSTGLWLCPYQRGAERESTSVQSGANTQAGERTSRVPSGEAESEVHEHTS